MRVEVATKLPHISSRNVLGSTVRIARLLVHGYGRPISKGCFPSCEWTASCGPSINRAALAFAVNSEVGQTNITVQEKRIRATAS